MQMKSDNTSNLGGEIREDAQNLTSKATDRLHDEVNARKEPLAEQARSVSSAFEKAAGELGGGQAPAWIKSALEQGAQQIQRFAETIEQQDSRQLIGNVRQLARDNPTIFLAACAAAGFAAARIFRAESDEPRRTPSPTQPPIASQYSPSAYTPAGGMGATP